MFSVLQDDSVSSSHAVSMSEDKIKRPSDFEDLFDSISYMKVKNNLILKKLIFNYFKKRLVV